MISSRTFSTDGNFGLDWKEIISKELEYQHETGVISVISFLYNKIVLPYTSIFHRWHLRANNKDRTLDQKSASVSGTWIHLLPSIWTLKRIQSTDLFHTAFFVSLLQPILWMKLKIIVMLVIYLYSELLIQITFYLNRICYLTTN